MPNIMSAVGRGGTNGNQDVRVVQTLLNQNAARMQPFTALRVDGLIGPKTIAAIERYQRNVLRFQNVDGRVDPGGTTLRNLNNGATTAPRATPTPAAQPAGYTYFSHPNASQVTLNYGANAVRMVPNAELLLKSILASAGMTSATLTSTLRTYHDQARITMTQTFVNNPATVARWYGQDVLDACRQYRPNIQDFANWWEARDRQRGRVSSRHLSNQALDVVPNTNRVRFASEVQRLVPVAGSGVQRIIPKGTMGEPVDHVEFTFQVCPR